MAFPNPAARNQYLKTQVETASKEQLVVMLFDGIIRFTEQARKAIENKEIEASHNSLMRAQAIVMELIVTVDKEKGGEIAQNLMALHAYSFNCLVQCNLRKDVTKIDEVQGIYRKLREGWVGAMENLGIVSGANKAPAAQGQPQAKAAPVPGKPVPPAPGGGKPLSSGIGATPAGARPVQKPGVGGGVLAAKPGAPLAGKPIAAAAAMAKPVAAPAAAVQKPAAVAPAPAAAPKPAAPAMAATGYGMGRSAALAGAYGAKAPVAAANAKQGAALGAYQQAAGTRSIA